MLKFAQVVCILNPAEISGSKLHNVLKTDTADIVMENMSKCLFLAT